MSNHNFVLSLTTSALVLVTLEKKVMHLSFNSPWKSSGGATCCLFCCFNTDECVDFAVLMVDPLEVAAESLLEALLGSCTKTCCEILLE